MGPDLVGDNIPDVAEFTVEKHKFGKDPSLPRPRQVSERSPEISDGL